MIKLKLFNITNLGCIYIPGSMVWSCLIGIYRMIYITAKVPIKNSRFFLRLTMTLGLVLHGTIFAIMLHYGEGSLVNKICSRYSSTHIQIIHELQVLFFSVFFKTITLDHAVSRYFQLQ